MDLVLFLVAVGVDDSLAVVVVVVVVSAVATTSSVVFFFMPMEVSGFEAIIIEMLDVTCFFEVDFVFMSEDFGGSGGTFDSVVVMCRCVVASLLLIDLVPPVDDDDDGGGVGVGGVADPAFEDAVFLLSLLLVFALVPAPVRPLLSR